MQAPPTALGSRKPPPNLHIPGDLGGGFFALRDLHEWWEGGPTFLHHLPSDRKKAHQREADGPFSYGAGVSEAVITPGLGGLGQERRTLNSCFWRANPLCYLIGAFSDYHHRGEKVHAAHCRSYAG